MGYGNKSLSYLRDQAYRIATEHGFKDASPAEDIALIHSELSEALEDIRNGESLNEMWFEEKVPAFDENGKRLTDKDCKAAEITVKRGRPYPIKNGDYDYDYEHPYKPCGIPSELADVIIRVLHFSGKHKIDIEEAVRLKMEYNETRPFMHGGKKI